MYRNEENNTYIYVIYSLFYTSEINRSYVEMYTDIDIVYLHKYTCISSIWQSDDK